MDFESADMGRIQECLNHLSEHFDTVQIFCTRHEAEIENGTIACTRGIGNWFARKGQVQEWVRNIDPQSVEINEK